MSKRAFNTIEERLNFLDFRQELLFRNNDTSRLLFEHEITQEEETLLMDLMDSYRTKISNGEKVTRGSFENDIYNVIPSKNGDYHFCEFIAQNFMQEGRWQEVFNTLYGQL
ncbi:TPA: hypothetical protein ACJHFP_003693 [Clostridioides difficile]|uniref:DUF1878 domain-containing protein n=1 Tax=Clostridioides difficile TaxID=1496 RepID=UPI001A90943A|nr:DUF1878 domain-containing protein [Clostridioides difficile]WLD30018.1 hypothetical protein CDIFMA2_39240 [Clostridioides difficile]